MNGAPGRPGRTERGCVVPVFRCALAVAMLALLSSCTRPANPAPVLSSPPSSPTTRPAPSEPVWTKEEPPRRTIRAVGREDLPETAPERVLMDLADALACEQAREVLARRASEGLRAKEGMDSAQVRSARLQAAIRRSPLHGCVIPRREIRLDKAGRRWCWSEAVLDSAEVARLLEREWKRLDPGGRLPPEGLLD